MFVTSETRPLTWKITNETKRLLFNVTLKNATSLFHRPKMDFSPRDRAEALLLKAARTHGIPATKQDVHSALSDTAFLEWANLHLATDHLLTGDELAL